MSSSSSASPSLEKVPTKHPCLPKGYQSCVQCGKPTRYTVTNSHGKYFHCSFAGQPHCVGCWAPSLNRGYTPLGDNIYHSVYRTDKKDPKDHGYVDIDDLSPTEFKDIVEKDIKEQEKMYKRQQAEKRRKTLAERTTRRSLRLQSRESLTQKAEDQ